MYDVNPRQRRLMPGRRPKRRRGWSPKARYGPSSEEPGMGRQLTDSTTRYWRRIPWPDEVDVADVYHAAWKLTGAPRCGVTAPRLSKTEYIQVGPGVDFLDVDPRVCPRCKQLADQQPVLIQMEVRV